MDDPKTAFPLFHEPGGGPYTRGGFQTDGHFLFVEHLERLISASKEGQMAMPDFMPRLERIERDSKGLPLRLYPFTRPADSSCAAANPKIVVVNPRVSFGRPSVAGVATSIIWNRFLAGDSPAILLRITD